MINLGSVLGGLAGEALGGDDNPLGQILSGLAGSGGSGQNESDILGTVLSVVQKSGGVGSVLEMFNKSGTGAQARSWVSTDPNEAVEPNQVEQALGNPLIASIASKLGVDPGKASSIVAAVLPELINQVTPKGDVTGEQDDIISKGLSLLGSL